MPPSIREEVNLHHWMVYQVEVFDWGRKFPTNAVLSNTLSGTPSAKSGKISESRLECVVVVLESVEISQAFLARDCKREMLGWLESNGGAIAMNDSHFLHHCRIQHIPPLFGPKSSAQSPRTTNRFVFKDWAKFDSETSQNTKVTHESSTSFSRNPHIVPQHVEPSSWMKRAEKSDHCSHKDPRGTGFNPTGRS